MPRFRYGGRLIIDKSGVYLWDAYNDDDILHDEMFDLLKERGYSFTHAVDAYIEEKSKFRSEDWSEHDMLLNSRDESFILIMRGDIELNSYPAVKKMMGL